FVDVVLSAHCYYVWNSIALILYLLFFFFFFSSRRRHTRFKCDWSSDVCSSDLFSSQGSLRGEANLAIPPEAFGVELRDAFEGVRSEERRVGKECRSRWGRYY